MNGPNGPESMEKHSNGGGRCRCQWNIETHNHGGSLLWADKGLIPCPGTNRS